MSKWRIWCVNNGGTPFSAPALAEVADIDSELMMQSWQSAPPDYFIFQTGVGVKALFVATDSLGVTEQLLQTLAGAKVAVRGIKPTAALRAREVYILT